MSYTVISKGDGTGEKGFECNECGCVFLEDECDEITIENDQKIYTTSCPVCNSDNVWRIPRILRDIYI